MEKFTITVASPFDREKLVAEIWFGENMIAELVQESENLELILYTEIGQSVQYREFIEALTIAQKKLLGA